MDEWFVTDETERARRGMLEIFRFYGIEHHYDRFLREVEDYHPMRIDSVDELGFHLMDIVQELSGRGDSRWNRETNQVLIGYMKEINDFINVWGLPTG